MVVSTGFADGDDLTQKTLLVVLVQQGKLATECGSSMLQSRILMYVCGVNQKSVTYGRVVVRWTRWVARW